MKKLYLGEYIEFNQVKFTKRVIFNNGESTVFMLNFMPGQKLPPHKHPGSFVYLHVFKGTGTFHIDEQATPVVMNDVIECNGDELLSFENTSSEPVSLYVVLTKIPDEKYATDI